MQCFKPNFIAESGSRASKDKKDAEPSSSVSGEEAVEALKARFQWRDEETEAALWQANNARTKPMGGLQGLVLGGSQPLSGVKVR